MQSALVRVTIIGGAGNVLKHNAVCSLEAGRGGIIPGASMDNKWRPLLPRRFPTHPENRLTL